MVLVLSSTFRILAEASGVEIISLNETFVRILISAYLLQIGPLAPTAMDFLIILDPQPRPKSQRPEEPPLKKAREDGPLIAAVQRDNRRPERKLLKEDLPHATHPDDTRPVGQPLKKARKEDGPQIIATERDNRRPERPLLKRLRKEDLPHATQPGDERTAGQPLKKARKNRKKPLSLTPINQLRPELQVHLLKQSVYSYSLRYAGLFETRAIQSWEGHPPPFFGLPLCPVVDAERSCCLDLTLRRLVGE